MKRFTIPCNFNGSKAPFHIYVGEPAPDLHPLYFQAAWLSEYRNGTIPLEVMESFQKLHAIAKENKVSFEELCVYALGASQSNNDVPTSQKSNDGGSSEPIPTSSNALSETPDEIS